MVINPHLELRLGKADDGIQSVTVHAPVKGDSLKVSTVVRAGDAELFEFLVLHSATHGAIGTAGVTPRVSDRLTEIGFLVSDQQVAAADRVWFSIADGVASPTFYSAAAAERELLAQLTPRAPAPLNLPAPFRAALVEAGALQPAASVEAHDASRRADVDHARATLHGRRWVVLEEVILPAQASLRRYYRDLIGEGFIRYADPEWPDRFFASREPLTDFFQQQLTDLTSDIAGEPLKPSFSFLASYRPGAELKPHRDRDQAQRWYSTLWFLFWVPKDFAGPLD